MSEKVIYRGKTYTVSRYVDKEDDKLLTPEKQIVAKKLFNQGITPSEVAKKINVDEQVLNVWWDNETRLDGISKSNKAFTNGKAKKVICKNVDTGVEVTYPSLSAAGKAVGCLASTVRYKILHGKKYKNYAFRYAED